MSKLIYRDSSFSRSLSVVRPLSCDHARELFPEPDRADQLSFVPVSRTVENFIASGRNVASLRQTTASVSESREKTLEEALKTELTEFDRNRYGIDPADAFMEVKRLEAKAEKVQRTKELLDEVKRDSSSKDEVASSEGDAK